MEEVPSNTIICPECNKEFKLGFSDMDKCLSCGSKKFDGISIIVHYLVDLIIQYLFA